MRNSGCTLWQLSLKYSPQPNTTLIWLLIFWPAAPFCLCSRHEAAPKLEQELGCTTLCLREPHTYTRGDANSLLCNLLYYSNFSLPLETRGCANETRSGWQVKVRVAPYVMWFLHNCYASSPFLTWTWGALGSQKPVIWWQTRWTLLRAPQPAAIRLSRDSDTVKREAR